MAPRRFRVALSFAGEKRDFVEQVADLLAARFGRDAILYDKYHEAEFARYDLGIRLPKLYGEESDLIVPVLCPRLRHEALDRLGVGPHLRPAHEKGRTPSYAQPVRPCERRRTDAGGRLHRTRR